MPDNKFNITVTATDAASKVVNKVNKNINKMFRPYDNAKKSIKSLSDAFGRNDLVKRPLWALEKVGRGVTMFGNAFGVAESSVLGGSARMAASLGMIGGPVGAFLAGATAIVGGAAAVGVAMAKSGQRISRTSQNLNVSTDALQEYEGAAKLAGLTTEQMDQGLLSLGENLTRQKFGLDPDSALMMQKLGVAVKFTKEGAVDTTQAFRDLADKIANIKDQNYARVITDQFGITELLPLLRKGGRGIGEYIAKVHELGIQNDKQIAENDAQAQKWNQTTTAMDAAGVSIGNLIAKYSHLNEVAAIVTKTASSLANSKEEGGWFSPAKILDRLRLPWMANPLSMLGVIADSGDLWSKMRSTTPGTAGRSASGKIGGLASSGASGSSPIGIRNNNPGNIRAGNGFASYATPGDGLTAMGRNLMAYQDKHGINTVSGIVNRWAPPSENNTRAYVSDVSRQTGFDPNQPLNLHDPQVLAPLMSAITRHENNGQMPYSPELLAGAIKDALGNAPIKIELTGVPAGMTVKAARGLGAPSVGAAMAPGGVS